MIRSTTFALLAGLAASSAHAQYSSNPATNLPVADRTSEQVQPKLALGTEGGVYVSWFDNADGGYDVYLQRLDNHGYEQWGHNGLLIADRGVSSTVDYDLDSELVGDIQRNALIAYNDDTVVPGTQQIVVQKVSPAGVKLWGPAGLNVSGTNANFKAAPKLAIYQDGSVAVGWVENSTGVIQRVSPAGALVGDPIVISEASRYIALSDIAPGAANSVVALWVRGSTSSASSSAKTLRVQSFDSANTPQWNAGTFVDLGVSTSIQNGTFPALVAAPSIGRFLVAWYETGGTRNAFLQGVSFAGALSFPAPIGSTQPAQGRIAIGATAAAFDGAGIYFAVGGSSTPTQGNYSVNVQRYSLAGVPAWGANGVDVIAPGAGGQQSFVNLVPRPTGVDVIGIDNAATARIFAARLDLAGNAAPLVELSTAPGGKSRAVALRAPSGQAIAAFTSGDFGAGDVLVQNLDAAGDLGVCFANCDLSTSAPRLNALDFSCFLSRYRAASLYANCDGSTSAPSLNALDFGCFLARFQQGCN